MIFKSKKFWAGIIILVIMIGLTTARGNKPQMDPNLIKESAIIAYPSKHNYRQTKNDCGPFNVAAVVRALKDQDVDSTLFAQEIGWRLPNDYTLPWGLENQLKENDIKIEKPNFNLLTDAEKITLLQQHLSLGKPIIILGERDDYEHYVTIFGFNTVTDEYYVYDSLQTFSTDEPDITTDENASFPGNKTFSSNELLTFWRGGGMYGLWEWYGLITSL